MYTMMTELVLSPVCVSVNTSVALNNEKTQCLTTWFGPEPYRVSWNLLSFTLFHYNGNFCLSAIIMLVSTHARTHARTRARNIHTHKHTTHAKTTHTHARTQTQHTHTHTHTTQTQYKRTTHAHTTHARTHARTIKAHTYFRVILG